MNEGCAPISWREKFEKVTPKDPVKRVVSTSLKPIGSVLLNKQSSTSHFPTHELRSPAVLTQLNTPRVGVALQARALRVVSLGSVILFKQSSSSHFVTIKNIETDPEGPNQTSSFSPSIPLGSVLFFKPIKHHRGEEVESAAALAGAARVPRQAVRNGDSDK